MAGWTNRGKAQMMKGYFQGLQNVTTNFQLALCTGATAPSPTTNVITDLTELSGSGYARVNVAKGAVDFTLTEDDSGNLGKIVLKNCAFTASGGSLTARYAVLLDDQSTPNVIAFWSLNAGADVTVSSGQTLTVSGSEVRITE